jgi:uncharacterized protein (TIGR03437 family)
MKSHPFRFAPIRALALAFALAAAAFALMPAQPARAARTAVDAALVNAASFAPDRVVAPGSIAALFSQGLMSGDPLVATDLPLPTSLGGLTVKIDGVAARLFFVSSSQINLQVPNGVDIGAATVEVFSGASTEPIASGEATIAESAPGVFTISQDGKNQATALNSDFSFNGDFEALPGSHPEIGGRFVTVFATGIGRTNPIVGDGEAAPGSPLANADGATAVTIGGVAGQVLFSGLAPGFVGLWQINVMLPADLPTNIATSLGVELKGQTSQPTTLAVANEKDIGTVAGAVVSALNGAPIAGAEVSLNPSGGQNAAVRRAATDANGEYTFLIVSAGNYNLTATAGGFIPATQPASVAGGADTVAPPIPLSLPLAAGQYRVVVTWRAGIDLDAHLTGAGTHIWWNGESDLQTPALAQFDRDDQSGAGPETITFTAQPGVVYRFSVQDYTNRDFDGSLGLNASLATVRVFFGGQQVAVFTPPSGGGTLWKVFELSNGQINPIGQLGDEPDPANIKTVF